MKVKRSRLWFVLLVLMLFPVALAGFIQTGPGKRVLASVLSQVLSREDGVEVSVHGIDGWIPWDVVVERVEVADKHGIWLSATDLQCRWILHELLGGRIHLRRLGMDSIEWMRMPDHVPRSATGSKKKPEVFPVEIQLDDLKVGRLVLNKDVAGMPVEYTVHSDGISLLASGQLAGAIDVGGDAKGRVLLNAVFQGKKQDRLSLKAELEQMHNPSFGLDRLSGRADINISMEGVEGHVEAGLEKDGQSAILTTRMHFKGNHLQFPGFHFTSPVLSSEGNLNLDFSGKRVGILLDATMVDAATNAYRLRGDAGYVSGDGSWVADISSLEFRGWDVVDFRISGLLAADRVALEGKLLDFNVGQLPIPGASNFKGIANGLLSITGVLSDPRIVAEFAVNGLSSTRDALDELPPLDLRIACGLADGNLFCSSALTNQASGFFSAGLTMPCTFSFEPFRLHLEPEKTAAKLNADFDMEILNRLALLENQRISGVVKAELRYADQKPEGFLRVEQGSYEHYGWGLVLLDLDAEIAAEKNGFVFKHGHASDGNNGILSISGGFDGDGLDLILDLDKAKAIRRPELEASLSGRLAVKGRYSHPDVKGSVSVDRADILIDHILAAKPPLLTNFDIHAVTNRAVSASAGKRALPFGVDIAVDLLDQVYVNASLIDSVWGGRLRVKDVPGGISIVGKIEPRRGYVNFIGKKFRFRQGEVVLDGTVPPVAVMNNLVAEYERSDITARLVLNGRLDDPQCRLESTPAMPQDEVLSHVLFNRDTSSISPYQAYQIAMAAQQLSGGLKGPGFMYQFRRVIGIDTLEWREPDVHGEASSVAAGKYITSGLYVEVGSSLEAGGETGMMAEYELTRHFSIETSTGPKMRPGVGINWKYDY